MDKEQQITYSSEEMEAIFNSLKSLVATHKEWLDGFVKQMAKERRWKKH